MTINNELQTVQFPTRTLAHVYPAMLRVPASVFARDVPSRRYHWQLVSSSRSFGATGTGRIDSRPMCRTTTATLATRKIPSRRLLPVSIFALFVSINQECFRASFS